MFLHQSDELKHTSVLYLPSKLFCIVYEQQMGLRVGSLLFHQGEPTYTYVGSSKLESS